MIRTFFGSFRSSPPASPAGPEGSEPIRLVADRFPLAVGVTLRRDAERRFGPGIRFPAPGWLAWRTPGRGSESGLLSAFFRENGTLIGLEHYLGKSADVPAYAPLLRVAPRLDPGEIGLGSLLAALPPGYTSTTGRAGSVRAIVYQASHEGRWPGGVAFVCGNDGRIERIAIYADVPR